MEASEIALAVSLTDNTPPTNLPAWLGTPTDLLVRDLPEQRPVRDKLFNSLPPFVQRWKV